MARWLSDLFHLYLTSERNLSLRLMNVSRSTEMAANKRKKSLAFGSRYKPPSFTFRATRSSASHASAVAFCTLLLQLEFDNFGCRCIRTHCVSPSVGET